MKRVYPKDKVMYEKVERFLARYQLTLEANLEEIYVVQAEEEIIATGCIQGKILKNICIDQQEQGSNLIHRVMSFLTSRAFQLGRTHLFIYTKPEASSSFEKFGFKTITTTQDVAFMENEDGFTHYLDQLASQKQPGQGAAVVVNCNPFTLGHQYLIETATKAHDWLYIFVVSEDASTIPARIRYQLIEAGTQHLKNVSLLETADYMVSKATFPSYFIKDDARRIKAQTEIDARIFCEHIAPLLNITTRYIGTEPYNPTTGGYNATLKRILPAYGIGVIELERLMQSGTAVSASAVRRFLKNRNYTALRAIVPDTTYDYFMSQEGQRLISHLNITDGLV